MSRFELYLEEIALESSRVVNEAIDETGYFSPSRDGTVEEIMQQAIESIAAKYRVSSDSILRVYTEESRLTYNQLYSLIYSFIMNPHEGLVDIFYKLRILKTTSPISAMPS